MGTERQVMQGYLDALVQRADFPAYFADDVVASFEGTDQTAVGRDRAGQLIRYVHENAFDARAELKTCWWMKARRRSRRISSAHIPASSPGSSLRAGPSAFRIRLFTTCVATRSAGCGFTSR